MRQPPELVVSLWHPWRGGAGPCGIWTLWDLGLMGPEPRGGPLDPDLMGPVPYGTWALWDLSLGGAAGPGPYGTRALWDLGLVVS